MKARSRAATLLSLRDISPVRGISLRSDLYWCVHSRYVGSLPLPHAVILSEVEESPNVRQKRLAMRKPSPLWGRWAIRFANWSDEGIRRRRQGGEQLPCGNTPSSVTPPFLLCKKGNILLSGNRYLKETSTLRRRDTFPTRGKAFF